MTYCETVQRTYGVVIAQNKGGATGSAVSMSC
jgi:hypothetical protein